MNVKFLPIASGSKGNCTYIASNSTKILIDCGITAKKTAEILSNSNIDINDINAIFITHEHTDHISGIGVLARKYKIPIYATSKTWEAIEEKQSLGKVDDRLKNHIYKEEQCIIDDIVVVPFGISHDAVDAVAYNVFINDKKISICTDIGVCTENVVEKLSDSHILLIEANHDIKMLETGSYPFMLKKRILGHQGHLSNVACANLLLSLKYDNLLHIFLGHLSEENNKPIIAMNTVKETLKLNNFKDDCKISLAHSSAFKEIYEL